MPAAAVRLTPHGGGGERQHKKRHGAVESRDVGLLRRVVTQSVSLLCGGRTSYDSGATEGS